MKIPQSVRSLYESIRPKYCQLQAKVDPLLTSAISERWHYESRIKSEESYALKLETGREVTPEAPEDMFGCTLVVQNHSQIQLAIDTVINLFEEKERRPRAREKTHLAPQDFSFDDLRLYVMWKDDSTCPPTGLEGVKFEIQVKTFLQHAWSIATHDLVYKSDDVSWGANRVAYQVKAMLENAELSISEARQLTSCDILRRNDNRCEASQELIVNLKERWPAQDALPKDLLRLCANIEHLGRTLKLKNEHILQALDSATEKGRGASVLNLSPYAAILEALILQRGAALFHPLSHDKNKYYVFVPTEVQLPELAVAAKKWILTPDHAN